MAGTIPTPRNRGVRPAPAARAVPSGNGRAGQARPRRNATPRRGRARGSALPAIPDTDASRYIVRIQSDGREIPGPIEPRELLVHSHRDNHPVGVAAEFVASRLIQITGNEERVRQGLRAINALGGSVAQTLGSVVGSGEVERRLKRMLGVVERGSLFKFLEPTQLSESEVRTRIERLQRDARASLRARGRNPRLHVLLTGGTGFLGKEILAQAAADRQIDQVVAVVRPETIRDPKTKEVVKVLTASERGALLLKRLGIRGKAARKFRFVEGDIEKPGLGLSEAEAIRLRTSLTHVVHCAASVSFDDTYDNSFRANVLGCHNALHFSLSVQRAPGSVFVHHVAIETSYIHGRKRRSIAQEGTLAFPRHFYNNFYELTKAMASIETDRAMVEHGLRVAQLLPSIVIGHSRTGNNRGDTKVVNAPINAFGRAKEARDKLNGDLLTRLRAAVLGVVASGFPGDRSAELNLVPVDRVAAGILAALKTPEAIGVRVHLATDNRIRSDQIVRITREELGVDVYLTDPTIYRNVTLPVVKAVLEKMNEPRLAGAMEKLASIFGGYSEWGQPIHDVGNDVRILGLPIRRPATENAFRMLCRHNRYVQEFGRVRGPDEVARRERIWEQAIEAIEHRTGREVGSLSAREFREHIQSAIDLRAFRRRGGGPA